MLTTTLPATGLNRIAMLHPGVGFRVEAFAAPIIDDDEVLVRVRACGICGSEINSYRAAMRGPAGGQPHIFGHEAAGTVEAVGAEVKGLRVGDRVAIAPNLPCGVCEQCHHGRSQVCLNRCGRLASKGGGYAELMAAKSSQCHLIPDHMSFDVAATLEPVACCLHTYTGHVKPRPGERVLIMGGGLNAQVFVQLARIQGASFVALRDSIPERLAMATHLGADAVLGEGVDPRAAHPQLELGADVVVVTRAKGEMLAQAIAWCRIGGRVLVYGSPGADETATIRPRDLQMKEISIIGSRSYGFEFAPALALVASGAVRTEALVTRGVSLETVASGFAADLHSGFKTVVRPNGDSR